MNPGAGPRKLAVIMFADTAVFPAASRAQQ
jgi:hypothetical protein